MGSKSSALMSSYLVRLALNDLAAGSSGLACRFLDDLGWFSFELRWYRVSFWAALFFLDLMLFMFLSRMASE